MSYAKRKRSKQRRKLRTSNYELDIDKMKQQYAKKKQEDELGTILVHGAMTYECESCGNSWRMWLEVGVEGRDKIMPCPFIIRCKCGGMARHVDWQNDIYLPNPMPIGDNMSYFKLDKKGLKRHKEDVCGIPVLK